MICKRKEHSLFMKNKKTIRDLLLVAIILVLAGGFYLGNRLMNRRPAVVVEVSVDGQVVKELDLSKDTEVVIESGKGGTNTLIIEHGEVYISDATCPDKICIHQGKINRSGELIVCLPNLMIAKIVGEE